MLIYLVQQIRQIKYPIEGRLRCSCTLVVLWDVLVPAVAMTTLKVQELFHCMHTHLHMQRSTAFHEVLPNQAHLAHSKELLKHNVSGRQTDTIINYKSTPSYRSSLQLKSSYRYFRLSWQYQYKYRYKAVLQKDTYNDTVKYLHTQQLQRRFASVKARN